MADPTLKIGALVALCICLALAASTGSCTDENQARRALEAQGFRDITVHDSGMLTTAYRGCSQGDTFWYSASGTNAAGKPVDRITVCCGAVFKGCTLRY
jgi:hypothetical protein